MKLNQLIAQYVTFRKSLGRTLKAMSSSPADLLPFCG